jgi:hypothetical protein
VCPTDRQATSSLQRGGERLDALGRRLLHRLRAGDDALDLREDGGPVLELEEGNVLLHAVGDQV